MYTGSSFLTFNVNISVILHVFDLSETSSKFTSNVILTL